LRLVVPMMRSLRPWWQNHIEKRLQVACVVNLWWGFLQKHNQSLENQVGKSWSNCDIILNENKICGRLLQDDEYYTNQADVQCHPESHNSKRTCKHHRRSAKKLSSKTQNG
jgi:hypothetical protein